MGATFSNIQLRLTDEQTERDAVLNQILSIARAEGTYRTADEGESADRIIRVGTMSPTRWVTIYDDEFEELSGAEELIRAASELSSSLHTSAVAVAVHDSDILELALYHQGKLASSLTMPAMGKRKSQGIDDSWKMLLRDPQQFSELKKLCANRPVFIEETLTSISELIGWEPDEVCAGIRHLPPEGAAGCLELRLVSTIQAELEPETGASPAFDFSGYPGHLEHFERQPFELSYSLRNTGGKADGLDIVIWGPLLEQKSGIDGLKARLQVSGIEREASFVHGTAADGSPILHAAFADCSIAAAKWNANNLTAKALFDRNDPSKFTVMLVGQATSSMQSECFLAFWPHAQTAGAATAKLDIRISRLPQVLPLHGVQTPHALHCAEWMNEPKVLFAFLVLRAGGTETLVKPAIHRWLEGVASVSATYAALYEEVNEKGQGRLKQFQIGPGKLHSHKRWTSLLEQWEQYPNISLADQSGSGFSFGKSSASFERIYKDRYLPHLVLYANAADWNDEQLRLKERHLHDIVDTLAEEQCLLQAYAARWATFPQPGTAGGGHLYEMACGIKGNVTWGERWNQTFLRGASGHMWVGDELLSRLDRAGLAAVADVKLFSNAAKLSLLPDKSLIELETELAAILPTYEQWYAWLKR